MRGGAGRWTRGLVWAIVASAVGARVSAQVRPLYGGQALDANPQVGNAGRNRPVPQFVPNSTNLLVTGNVAGGRAFRGFSPIRDSSQLFVGLPSSALTDFRRDSVSVAEVSAGRPPLGLRPYFAPEQTVTNVGAIGAGLNQPGTSRPRSPFMVPRSPARLIFPDGLESLTDPRPRGDLLALPPIIGTRGAAGVSGALDPYGAAAPRLTRPGLAASLPWPSDPRPSIVPTYPTQALERQFPLAPPAGTRPPDRRQTEPRGTERPGDTGAGSESGSISPLSPIPLNTRLESQLDMPRITGGALPPAAMPIATARSRAATAGQNASASSVGSAELGLRSATSGIPGLPESSQPILSTRAISGRTPPAGMIQSPLQPTGFQVDDVLGGDRRAPLGPARPAGPARDETVGRSWLRPIGQARLQDASEAVPQLGSGLTRPVRPSLSRDERNHRRAQRLEAMLDRPVQSFQSAEMGPIDRYLQAAEAHLDAGEYYRAASRYDGARVIDPRDPRPFLGKGHALIGSGDYLSAVYHLQRGIILFAGIDRLQLDLPAMMPHEAILERRRADLEQRLAGDLASDDRIRFRFLLGYIELYSGLEAFGRKNLSIAAEAAPTGSLIRRLSSLLGAAAPPEAASPATPPGR